MSLSKVDLNLSQILCHKAIGFLLIYFGLGFEFVIK